MSGRNVITIEMPADTSIDVLALLDLIEPGASGHTLMVEHGPDVTTVRHSRLGVSISTSAAGGVL